MSKAKSYKYKVRSCLYSEFGILFVMDVFINFDFLKYGIIIFFALIAEFWGSLFHFAPSFNSSLASLILTLPSPMTHQLWEVTHITLSLASIVCKME